MSIWGTVWHIADDDHAEDCARWVECGREEAETAERWSAGDDRAWRYDPALPCTCAAGPLAYQRSHVVPAVDGPRAGNVELATVASHIGPDRCYRDEDGTHLPFVRLSLRGSKDEPDTVVLDRRHAAELLEALRWAVEEMEPEVTA